MVRERKTKKKKFQNKKLWLILGGVGLTLIAVGILLFFLLRPIPIRAISFELEEISLKAGESFPLRYDYQPENATKTALSFKTSNRSVATVQNGVLTGVSEGSCYISITAESGAKDNIHVIVEAPMTELEDSIVGNWEIFAVQRDGKLNYVYNDDSTLSLSEDRSGLLIYEKTEHVFPDWRYAESLEGYECFTVKTAERKDLTLYFCTDSASAYENCLMLRLTEEEMLLFRKLPEKE